MSFHRYAVLFGTACAACLVTGQAAYGQAPSPAAIIRLDEASKRALNDAPALDAAEAAAQASEAAVRQVDRALNPTIDFLLENAAGSGLYQGINRSETTLSFSQTLEQGGDRKARTELAARRGDIARILGDAARQDLLQAVEMSFVDAQRAALELAVAEERLALAREISATVERRVAAARDPLVASSRSLTLLADADIAFESARRVEAAARARLASFWGGGADFTVEIETFLRIDPSSAPAALHSPELAAASAREREAEAQIAMERARGQRDTTVSAGVRYFGDNGEAAFVLGFSMPIGVNDDNGAAIDRASAQRQRARFAGEALRRDIERQVAAARAQMDIASAEIQALDRRLLPAAQEAVNRARQGYAQGGFSYLDLLDAQRVLATAQLQRIWAFASHHRARTALKRLLGGYVSASPAQRGLQ